MRSWAFGPAVTPRKRTDALTALIAIALLFGTAYLWSSRDREQPVSSFSTYDTGRNGYRALFDVLGREGIDVSRFEYPLGLLGSGVRTLVIPPAAPGLEGVLGRPSGDAAALAEWTKKGGTLVVFVASFSAPDRHALALPELMQTRRQARSIARAPNSSFAQTRGVRAVRGDFETVFRRAKNARTRVLLRTPGGAVAVAYAFGGGEVVAMTDPTVFSNLRLGERENARFSYNVLARGPTAFYERANGYTIDRSFWSALPPSAHVAVYCVAVIGFLALIGGTVRFAPPLPVDNAEDRDSGGYIVSMARLLARGHAASRAVEDVAEAVTRALRRRLADVDDLEIRADISELERLRALRRPSEGELLRAGQIGARLRKALE